MSINEELFCFYTKEIYDEIKDVISREKFRITEDKQKLFLYLIQESSFKIEQLQKYIVKICRDTNDDKFLSLAEQIDADFIITWDQDLLVLEKMERTLIIAPDQFMKLFRE